MARAQVEVVAVDDVRSVDGQSMLREVASLWMTQRVDQGMSPEAATRAAADGRLREALGRADVRAWVARVDGTAVGYAITSENPFGLSTQPEVAIDQIFVDRRARRHGVARALLTTVVAHAERRGSEVIVSNVPAQSREANRFFARWGFSSVVVRRVVSTSVLRRRLTITGSTLRPRSVAFKTALAQALRRNVWPWLEAGRVKPVIFKVFPAAEAAAAHALMESNQHVGKIVLAW